MSASTDGIITVAGRDSTSPTSGKKLRAGYSGRLVLELSTQSWTAVCLLEIATVMLSKTMFHSFFVHSEKAEFDQSMGAFMSRLQTTEAKLCNFIQ